MRRLGRGCWIGTEVAGAAGFVVVDFGAVVGLGMSAVVGTRSVVAGIGDGLVVVGEVTERRRRRESHA